MRKRQMKQSGFTPFSSASFGYKIEDKMPVSFLPEFKGRVGDSFFYCSTAWQRDKSWWKIIECREDRPFVLAVEDNNIREAFLKVDFQTGVIKLSGRD